MFGSKEENSLVEQRTDDSGEDKKLRGAVRNMSSASWFSSSDCIEVFEKPGRLSGQEFVGKDETEKVKRSEIKTRLKCGSISVIGRRRVMEDALTVAPGMMGGEYEFFAVYDGHGGAMLANACRERLHQLLENELDVSSMDIPKDKPTMSGGENGVNWIKVMKACFSKMDDEVLTDGSGVGAGEAERAVGTTAVVVLVGTEELVAANCGDSRAVLCRSGVAMPLSNDHKADRPDEKERVEAAGGRIINWDGCRVQGVLATSRSIGDHYLKPYVISEPEVTVNKRTDSDDFLIIASDGLWDVVSNGVACDVARRCLNGRISKKNSEESNALADAAAILVELAIAKGSRDNISVIVVDIKKASNKISRA